MFEVFDEKFTLAKLIMPTSQQRNMIEIRFKNWHVQENQLYKLTGTLIRAGVLITVNTVIK